MALLCCCYSPVVAFSSPSPSPLSSSPSSSVSSVLLTVKAASRLPIKPITLPPNSFGAISYPNEKRGLLIARADSNAEGTGPADGGEASLQNREEAVDKLPLESKLQEKAEQKLRMKLAKKIRLRRKRLVRKRRLRKKGRWPPSKVKKMKNV